MEYLWIPITVVAAVIETLRIALQKDLKRYISDMAVVWVRYVYALPFAFFYVTLFCRQGHDLPFFSGTFFFYILTGSLAQLTATAMFVRLFSFRNFAVSKVLVSTDLLFAALLGFILFGDEFSSLGIFAIGIGVVGVVLTLAGKQGIRIGELLSLFGTSDSWLGIGSGALFAVTALSIREAIRTMPDVHLFFAASLVLLGMILVQAVVIFCYLLLYQSSQFARIYGVNRRSFLVGISSLVASIGWYSAFALTHPAYVKTLAQIQLPMVIVVGALFFGEKINKTELGGILLITTAIITVALSG